MGPGKLSFQSNVCAYISIYKHVYIHKYIQVSVYISICYKTVTENLSFSGLCRFIVTQ